MSKSKVIVSIVAVIILSMLGGFWGGKLYVRHEIRHIIGHRMERFAECGQPPFMFGHRMERCGKIINELDLTADQRKKVNDILTKNRDERKKLMDSLREAQEQLKTVVFAKEFNETAFRQGFQKVSSS